MVLKRISLPLTVCKVPVFTPEMLQSEFSFLAHTDEEYSLVCPTAAAPDCTLAREDGWEAFRIEGVLDFSLIGILASIASVLAGAGISIFAVSTYNTDYVLVKAERIEAAITALRSAGYSVEEAV